MVLKSWGEYKYLSLKTQTASIIFLKNIVNMQMISGKNLGFSKKSIALKTLPLKPDLFLLYHKIIKNKKQLKVVMRF